MMSWLQDFWPGNRKLPSVPGGDASRDAVVALYVACGFPAPKVVVASDQNEFDVLVARVSTARPIPILVSEMIAGSFFVTVICWLLEVAAKTASGTAATLASTNRAYDPTLAIHMVTWVVSAAVFCFWVAFIVVPLLRRVLEPTFSRAVPLPSLVEAVVSAGCLVPFPGNNDPRRGFLDLDFVLWGSRDRSALPDLPSAVGDLAVAARRTVDAAFLAGGMALVLPAGLAEPPATLVLPDQNPVSWKELRRRARQIRSMNPADAQEAATVIGIGRVVHALDLQPISTDASGSLWQLVVNRGRLRWLQSTDPANGNDVWLAVPGHVTSAREAVAWSYGVSAADYAPTLEG